PAGQERLCPGEPGGARAVSEFVRAQTLSKIANVIARMTRHTPAMTMLRLRRRLSFSSGLSFTINWASGPRPIFFTSPLVVSTMPWGAGLETGALAGREAGIGPRGCGAAAGLFWKAEGGAACAPGEAGAPAGAGSGRCMGAGPLPGGRVNAPGGAAAGPGAG